MDRKNYEPYKPTVAMNDNDKKDAGYRIAQMLAAQHNFVVAMTLGSRNPDSMAGNKNMADAIDELMIATKNNYPKGPDQMRSDIATIGLLVGAEVIPIAIEKSAALDS